MHGVAPQCVAAVELGGVRTVLLVPMLKENELIGALALFRQEVRPFTDKQIALVTSFATQAVIAIENAHLLSELRLRTEELGRSVEELRALGEVSQAVNSTLDLETVLNTSSPMRRNFQAPRPARSTFSTSCNANFICAPPLAWGRNDRCDHASAHRHA